MENTALKRTALYDEHRALGARLVPFAGWEMPVQYEGVLPEARAARAGCGLFDVSHMGQLDVRGEGVTEALNRVVSFEWSQVEVGRAAYALLLNEGGGVEDDIIGYHLAAEHWFIIVNASRALEDEAYLSAHLPPSLRVSNNYADQAMIAVQGPRAEELLQTLLPTDITLGERRWRDCFSAIVQAENEPVPCLFARGGYTGLDGFELMLRADDAPRVWRALTAVGAVPCGLGARDALRLEAALPLYGHELRPDWTPYQSGCGWAVKREGDFVGKSALVGKQHPERRIRALQMEGRAIPREGYEVLHGGEVVGVVTSGTLSPALNIGIALAMVPAHLAAGDALEIGIRGAKHAARLVKPPFVSHGARK